VITSINPWLGRNTIFLYLSYGTVVQRVFVLGVYFVAPQSVAPVFSVVDSHLESGRNIPVFISCTNESQRSHVPRDHPRSTCMVCA